LRQREKRRDRGRGRIRLPPKQGARCRAPSQVSISFVPLAGSCVNGQALYLPAFFLPEHMLRKILMKNLKVYLFFFNGMYSSFCYNFFLQVTFLIVTLNENLGKVFFSPKAWNFCLYFVLLQSRGTLLNSLTKGAITLNFYST